MHQYDFTCQPPRHAKTLNKDTWNLALADDPDRDYLMHGINSGFSIINSDKPADFIETDNYKSATSSHQQVEQQILQEIKEGRYLVVEEKPQVISALGAIPKPDGNIRLIHDCSRPAGQSINDYAKITSDIKYQTVSDAAKEISMDCYLSKIDLKNAYRSISIQEDHYKYSGLKWTFTGH